MSLWVLPVFLLLLFAVGKGGALTITTNFLLQLLALWPAQDALPPFTYVHFADLFHQSHQIWEEVEQLRWRFGDGRKKEKIPLFFLLFIYILLTELLEFSS